MFTKEFVTALATEVAKQVVNELPSAAPTAKEENPIYGIKELAKYLGVTVDWIHKRTGQRKEIPHMKVGGHLMFRKLDIDAWLMQWKVPVINPLSAGIGTIGKLK